MSSSFGPFSVKAGILQRLTDIVDAVVRTREGTTALRLWGARSLNDAYGDPDGSDVGGAGPAMFMEVDANRVGISPSLVNRGQITEERRGQTTFLYRPDDFAYPDDQMMYIRVQESRRGVGWLGVDPLAVHNPGMPLLGPILPVAPAKFYGVSAGYLVLAGIAPSDTLCTFGNPPVFDETMQVAPPPMHIVFPRPAVTVTVRNLEAVGSGIDLLIGWGLGMPMTRLGPQETLSTSGGGYTQPNTPEILLAYDGAGGSIGAGGCTFSVEAIIGHEFQG